MYEVIGQTTGKVYMTGNYKNECLRELHKKYPSTVKLERYIYNRDVSNVYPEPLLIRKVVK